MIEIKESIDINAAPDKVWSIIADLPSWKTWNTFVINAETKEGGELRVGAHQVITVAMNPGTEPSVYTNEITILIPEKKMAWVGKMPYIPQCFFEATHWCTLEPINDGKGCRFIQAEEITGVLVPAIRLMEIGENLRTGYKRMNSELKTAAEAP